jgi:hypothetical protein
MEAENQRLLQGKTSVRELLQAAKLAAQRKGN